MLKKLSLSIVIGLCLVLFPLLSNADVVDSGICGDNAIWTLDDAGKLIISGSGDITSCPWSSDSVKNVVIEKGIVRIGREVFANSYNLTSITMSEGITHIDDYAFRYCYGLTSIVFPNSLNSIGYESFYGCSGLTTLTIPENVITISNFAFSECTNLKSVTMQSKTKDIDFGYIFWGCSALTHINIPSDHRNYCSKNGIVFNTDNNEIVYYPCGRTGHYSMPNSITRIGANAFASCTGLTSIVISSNVTSIGNYAFSGCSGLTNISIPDSVVEIGEGAFYECLNIENISIPKAVSVIADFCFWDCKSLKRVEMSDAVVCIGQYTFYGCSNLVYASIPENVEEIQVCAFDSCASLTNIIIPKKIKRIEQQTFYNCASLISIIIPQDVTSIGPLAFGGCTNLTSIIIPDSIAEISDSAFSNCPSLKSISIPSKVTKISDYTFYGCTNLENVNISPNITQIGEYAFLDCSLSEVLLHQGISQIGVNAFDKSVLIHAPKNSYAANYAYSNYYNIHILDTHEKVEASCTASGIEAYYECPICHKLISAINCKEIEVPIIIPAAHTLAWHEKMEPTFFSEGVEEYWECTGCGKYFSDAKGEKEINAPVAIPMNDKVAQFVNRCYKIILERQSDLGGLQTWYNELVSGRKAASEIIDNFVRSQEFLGKHYSNADAVEILYKAMLGRGSDAPGKATWVGKLDASYPFAVVINGFCGSKEFKEICDSYGIAPGSVSMEQGSASDQQIRAFVTRCYKIILGRDPDEVGMSTWFSELKSRRRTAAEIIEQFVYSQEFQNKKYSNPDAVEILYKAMLGRGSDPAGKADWVGRLAGGQPLTAIINGFCGSMEFTAICEAYGITPGSVKVETVSRAAEEAPEETVQKPEKKANLIEITNPSDTVNEQLGTAVQAIYINEEKAKEFIGRCYRCILGREAGAAELDSWISQMTDGSKTADQIARGFLFSGEFAGRNVSNEELVKILYRVYMNREADAEGLATWTQKLDEGTGLNDLLNVFAKTNEFKAVLKNMAE